MPKLAKPLTAAAIKQFSATPKEARPIEVRDGGCRGLILRLERSGLLSWHHSTQDGRQKLGTFPELSLAQARSLTQSAKTPEKKSTLTLRDVFTRYAEWLKATKTTKQAKSNLTNFTPAVLGDLSSLPLPKLDHSALDDWLGKRLAVVGKTTAKRNLTAIKAALNKAVSWGLLPCSPIERYNFKAAPNRRTRTLSAAEKEKLVVAILTGPAPIAQQAAHASIGALACVCLYAGLRKNEALTLDWSDISLDHALIHVRGENAKSAKGRTVPLHPVAREALERLPHREGPVFPGRQRKHMSEPKKGWHALRARAGLSDDVGLHTLRHSFATELVQHADLETVRTLLGHADIKTTAIYLHTSGAKLRSAIDQL